MAAIWPQYVYGKMAHTYTEIAITTSKTHDAVRKPQGRTLRQSPANSMKSVAASKYAATVPRKPNGPTKYSLINLRKGL